jgi:hypothetical protein
MVHFHDFCALNQSHKEMKKNVLVFGSISGSIITAMMLYAAWMCNTNPKFESNDVLGYAGMIAAFAFIFVGIRNYRDKYNGGAITFGKAFKTGAYISLVASTMYVLVWLIDYYIFIPGFIDQYTTHVLYQAGVDGASQSELDQKAAEMADFKELYKNPVFVILITYSEVLPLGLIISLISALFLKKKIKSAPDPAS